MVKNRLEWVLEKILFNLVLSFQRTVWENNLKRSLDILVLYLDSLEPNTKRHIGDYVEFQAFYNERVLCFKLFPNMCEHILLKNILFELSTLAIKTDTRSASNSL